MRSEILSRSASTCRGTLAAWVNAGNLTNIGLKISPHFELQEPKT